MMNDPMPLAQPSVPPSVQPVSAEKNAQHSQFALLRERRFLPLFVTQFLGAFNDNAYKNALLVLLAFGTASWTSLSPEVLTNLAGAIFMLPYFLFSAVAGILADKLDKARIARWVKALEVFIIALAGLGFWLHSLTILLCALGLLGVQATFFGPVKYAILPQHLRANELVGGNALVEAGTFVAILLGTLVGGMLAGMQGGILWIVGVCLMVALGGFFTSCRIPSAPPSALAPKFRFSPVPFLETGRCIGVAYKNHSVFQSILGISWFWAFGSVLLTQFPLYTKAALGGDEGLVTALLAIFSVGIGSGSLICEKLTRRRGKVVEPGLVPIGALGMTLFGLDLALGSPDTALQTMQPLSVMLTQGTTWRVFFDLLMLGGFGGIYCVPLYALVQQRSPEEWRARMIAANNILNSLFIVITALATGIVLKAGFSIPTLFLGMTLLHGVVTAYIFSVVPEFLIRALIWLGWRKE